MTWAVVLCRFQDVATETASAVFMRNYFTRAGAGMGGSFDYWQRASGGRFVDDSQVFGWFTIPHNASEIVSLSRSVYQQWALDAAAANRVDLSRFSRRIYFFNANGDHGATGGGTTVFAYAPGRTIEPTFVAHETGHTLGLGHSFSDSAQGCCGSGTAGEYCDPWDIMSAMCVFRTDREPTARDSGAGPLLGAALMDQLGWVDPGRVTRWAPPAAAVDITLAPLHSPRDPGALSVRIDLPASAANPATTFFIELRIPESWDGGLPRAAVLIRKSQPQLRSILVGSGRQGRPDLDWQVGDTFISGGTSSFSVAVLDVSPRSARLRLTALPEPAICETLRQKIANLSAEIQTLTDELNGDPRHDARLRARIGRLNLQLTIARAQAAANGCAP